MSISAVEPLRVPQFRALWMASVVSNIGSFLQSVAAGWLMLELTGSTLWVAAMSATTTLPLLFLALHAGALADVLDRRKLLLAAQTVMGIAALAMAVLNLLDLLEAPSLLALGLLLGTGMAFNLPAWQAMVPDLVPRGMVASAVALNSVAFNVARAVGPALGGLVVALWGPSTAFGLNALSYLGIIGVILSLGGAFRAGETATVSSAVATGLRFARYTPVFRTLLLIAAGFAVTSAPIQAILPNFTSDVLGGSEVMYGALLGAMGVGALVGAFTRPRVGGALAGRMVPLSMVGFSLSGVAVGISRTPVQAGVAMAMCGLFWVWTLATLNATVQLLAPPWVRGRAMSLYMLAFTGILPLGALLAGVIGLTIGPGATIAWMSAAGLLLALGATRLRIPSLAEVAEIEHQGDFTPTPHPVAVAGTPVLVVNTWVIADEDLEPFLATMNELRLVRLRTGALRWRLYRNVDDVHRMSELMVLGSWDQHLAQHNRLDAAATELIHRARAFDTAEGPVTIHLAGVDVTHLDDLPDWEALTPLVDGARDRSETLEPG
jgi:MFS family permease